MSDDRRDQPTTGDELPGDERIARALAKLEPGLDPLRAIERLKRELPAELARQAASAFALRRKSGARFPSGRMRSWTRKGFEQATREAVATARAERIAALVGPGRRVYDATCGMGSDAVALTAAGLRVVAGDLSLEAARCTRDNLAAIGPRPWVIVADANHPPLALELLLLDPDRRARGARTLDPKRWSPSLEQACLLAARAVGACIKLAPSVDIRGVDAHLPPALTRRWQWVSCGRELCEIAVWTGKLAVGSRAGEREALALPLAGRGGSRIEGQPLAVGSVAPEEVSKIQFLAEPDPAVVQSRLLGNLARELELAPLGGGCGYLAGDREPRSPLVVAWRVVGAVPADERRVRALLAAHDIGPLQVRKSGHAEPAELLARRFRGPGRRQGRLAIAGTDHGRWAFLLEPLASGVGDEGIEPPTSSL